MSGYVKTFKVKYRIDVFLYEKLLEKYKAMGTKIEDLKYIELNAIKTKIRTYGDKVYTNFHGLNVPEE